VLQSRLSTAITAPLLAISMVVGLVGCSDGDGSGDASGALEENVVAPGITAIDESTAIACETDANILRTALESFELIEGSPAESEEALLATGYLTDESELFDVVDGQVIAVAASCKGEVVVTTPTGETPASAPATELGQMVTDEDLLDAAGVFDAMTPEDVAEFGGEACARELADVFAAGERFVAREGRVPASLDDLANDLDGDVTLWELDESGDILVPTAGSPCPDVFSTP
jgi:hypothetical protein